MMAASLGNGLRVQQLYAGLSHLTPEEAEMAAPLIPHFAAISEAGFALVVDFTLSALATRFAEARKGPFRNLSQVGP